MTNNETVSPTRLVTVPPEIKLMRPLGWTVKLSTLEFKVNAVGVVLVAADSETVAVLNTLAPEPFAVPAGTFSIAKVPEELAV